MPSPSLTLWIDIATGKLVSGWQSISFAPNPVLKQGDTIGVELHLIKNFNGGSFAEYEFSPSTAVTLAIGRVDTAPESGTFKLVYGTDTTSALNATASASEVQTALNALASVTAEGGLTVTKVSNSFRIVWNTASVTSNQLSYSFNELYPTSSIGINKTKTGSVSPAQKQIYQIHIKQSPVANITSFVNQDVPAVSVSQIHAPAFTGDVKVWRVSILPQPKNGSFLIGFSEGLNEYKTDAIDINSSADTVRTKLSSAYDANWNVVKSGTNQWDISTSETAVFNVVVSDGGVVGFSSKYGVLDLNTAELEDMLAGELSTEATLEVQLETDGTRTTVIQQQVTVLNDLIDDASYNIVQWGNYLPADSVVRYDTSQTLSLAEKAQAKQNIGVLDVDTASLTEKDVELEGRIGDLEAVELTPNQFAAINGSSLPSATNVLITESALASEIATKANTTHTHTISDVTGLTLELSDKSDVGHTHIIGDVSGLATAIAAKADTTTVNTALLGKSDTSHTHTEFTTLEVTSGLTISNGSTGIPWGTPSAIEEVGVNVDPSVLPPTGIYPVEIPIKINGITYLIPARIYP
jgi:hypothetical protein